MEYLLTSSLTFGIQICPMGTDWFENWFNSLYYKILYQHRDELEAQVFLEKLLAHLQPSDGCRMVDIACGEGRFARQLAGHGYDVTGIDISECSIESAKQYEHERLHFMVQDMRLPFYTNYFDYAFNFFTSFGYFAHDRDHLMAAKAFAGALKPGGTLVIDYLNREYVLNRLVPEERLERDSLRFHITRKLDRNHIVKNIVLTDADGTEKRYIESVAAFSLADFELLMAKAGLHVKATFGDYTLKKYDAVESPRLIMIFEKK
jgi:SAM-dependent methyltransferase